MASSAATSAACRARPASRHRDRRRRRADERHRGESRAQRGGLGDDVGDSGRPRRRPPRPVVVSEPLRAASAPRAWVPSASTWSASAERSRRGASSCGLTSASPAAVSVGPAVAIPAMVHAGHEAGRAERDDEDDREPDEPPASGADASPRAPVRSVMRAGRPGRAASSEVAERALHRPRLEPEPGRDDVERADVVELAAGGAGRWRPGTGRRRNSAVRATSRMSGTGIGTIARRLPSASSDLAGDLAIRPVARPAQVEGRADRSSGRRTARTTTVRDVVDVDRLEARLAVARDRDDPRARSGRDPATMLKNPSPSPELERRLEDRPVEIATPRRAPRPWPWSSRSGGPGRRRRPSRPCGRAGGRRRPASPRRRRGCLRC